ncbi:MAG: glycoside hydrolase family 76 protein [Mycobacteriales bacterium]
MTWSERADAAQRALVDHFWDGRRGLYRVAPGRRLIPAPQWHYWWQAHALDATVDAVGRTGDPGARERARAHVAGIIRRNGGHIPNDYYDDMAWMALALLRADEITGVDTSALVAELWADIRQGWDQRHGGLVWRRKDTYTNTPANAPSAILAARLHRRLGDTADLDWARRIADWQHATLVDRDSGLVWDGIHPETDPGPSRELYTYNQGTVVGAEVELWRLTGDVGHRERAERTAVAALSRFADPTSGLLPVEGAGDGGLFKGILARYLGELVRATGAKDEVIEGILIVLRRNGEAVAVAGDRPVGADWRRPVEGDRSLSTHLSAVLLLESLAAADPSGSRVGDRDG